jgi:hypothetical protein
MGHRWNQEPRQEPEIRDWKQHHADTAEKALEHPLAAGYRDEFVDNMRRNFGVDLGDGLPAAGLAKVCSAVAQVARAEALGFDPELLRLSPEEADRVLLQRAVIAARTGKPVWAIEAPGADEEAGAS